MDHQRPLEVELVAEPLAMAVMALGAVRFAITGVAQLVGTQGWLDVAGWIGLVLAALSLYAALALELQAAHGRQLLPTGRPLS